MENGRTWESKETRRTQKFGWKINSAESIELPTVNKSSKWILIGATDIPNPHTYSWKVLKRRRKDRRYQQTISNWIHLCTSFPLLFRKEPKRTNENSVRSTERWTFLNVAWNMILKGFCFGTCATHPKYNFIWITLHTLMYRHFHKWPRQNSIFWQTFQSFKTGHIIMVHIFLFWQSSFCFQISDRKLHMCERIFCFLFSWSE